MRTMKDLLSVNVEKHLTLSFPLFREQRSLKFPQLAFSEKKKFCHQAKIQLDY